MDKSSKLQILRLVKQRYKYTKIKLCANMNIKKMHNVGAFQTFVQSVSIESEAATTVGEPDASSAALIIGV